LSILDNNSILWIVGVCTIVISSFFITYQNYDIIPLAYADSPFTATWRAIDTDTNRYYDLTRLEITQTESTIDVRAWEDCNPTDCDWGTQSGYVDDNLAVVIWNNNLGTTCMILMYDDSSDQLTVEVTDVVTRLSDLEVIRYTSQFEKFSVPPPPPPPPVTVFVE